MKKYLVNRLLAGAIVLAVPTFAAADEAAEKLVEEALPQMYHTCTSLVELADGDEAVVIDVLGKITAVSIYMRKIDIESYAYSDAQREEAKERFYQTISDGCSEDSDALLAGIVDDAVKAALGI